MPMSKKLRRADNDYTAKKLPPMNEGCAVYGTIPTIPTYTNNLSFAYQQNIIYFNSNNSIYSIINNKIKYITSVDKEITHLITVDNTIYVTTTERVYVITDGIKRSIKKDNPNIHIIKENKTIIITDSKYIYFYILSNSYNKPFTLIKRILTNITIKNIAQHDNNILFLGYNNILYYLSNGATIHHYKDTIEDDNNTLDTDKNTYNDLSTSNTIGIKLIYKFKNATDFIQDNNKIIVYNYYRYYIFTKDYKLDKIYSYDTVDDNNILNNKVYDSSTNIKSMCKYKEYLIVLTANRISFYFNNEEIYHINNEKYGIENIKVIENNIIFIEDKYFSIFDFKKKEIVFTVPLCRILAMDMDGGEMALGCDDGKVRIYSNGVFYTLDTEKTSNKTSNRDKDIKTLESNDQSDTINLEYNKDNSIITHIHYRNNIILTITSDGRISMYDRNRLYLYKSYNLYINISVSAVNSTNTLLYISNIDTSNILVIDSKRGKIIDELIGHESIVKKIISTNNHVFTTEIENKLIKWNITKSIKDTFMSERGIIDICIDRNIIILTEKEIEILDLNFNYIKSISYNTDKHLYYNIISTSKDNRRIIIGGETNKIKIIDIESGVLLKTLRVTYNKNRNNYKEKDREIEKKIEVKKIITENDNSIYIYSTEGITYYNGNTVITEKKVKIENTANPLDSMVLAIENKSIGLIALIERLDKKEIKYIINTLPELHCTRLRAMITELILDGNININIIRILKEIILRGNTKAINNNLIKRRIEQYLLK